MDLRFNELCVQEQNRLRKLHGCPPVRVDPHLVQKAQALANRMALSQTIITFGDPTIGENFYMNFGRPTVSAERIVNEWYSEIRSHTFGAEKQPNSLNFSQLIWKSTTRVGYGRTAIHGGCTAFVVALFQVRGNVTGDYTENVPPRLDGTIPVDLGSAGLIIM
ncbi:hypothetical protein CRM22_002794 [Opisthorchis felineus]|uniref:SCP domain-containing protein n=1 Tax=Opisthorchis felineus TaxID=147828 RepID=A0A4S2M4D6_OPIFE|nr:hypothetical protein CRM22_002794 [Opisthorchis felineus]